MTQDALAERLHIATKNLQRIESGRQNLTLQTVDRIAKALGVTPASLVVDPPRKTAQPRRRDTSTLKRPPFTRVAGPSPKEDAVPLMTLRAAAGAFGAAEAVEVDEWVVPSAHHRLSSGMFVARVDGDSMEPLVPAGSYVLLRAPVHGALVSKIVLVQLRGVTDPETGGSYALKRVERIARLRTGRAKVRLVSENPTHAPLDLTLDDGTDVRFVAELVEVLGEPSST